MFSNSKFPAVIALGQRFNDEDETGSDDNSNTPDIDSLLADENFMAKLLESEPVRNRISSVESERDKLVENNKKLLGQNKKAQAKAQEFEQLIQSAADNKEFELLKNGELTAQQLRDKWRQEERQAIQPELEAWEQKYSEAEKRNAELMENINKQRLNDVIGKAALSHEQFRKGALSHFMKAASETWKMEEDGTMVARDEKGNVIFGKNGKPITESEWLENLPDNPEYQHYFDFPQGSGARPGSNGSADHKVTLDTWRKMIDDASEEEEKQLFAKRESGEIKIVR